MKALLYTIGTLSVLLLGTSTGAAPRVAMEEFMLPAVDPGITLYVRNKHPVTMNTAPAEKIVLYMHGATYPAESTFDLPLNGLSWMDYIAQRGYDVYLVDVRGYGRSTRPSQTRAPSSARTVPLSARQLERGGQRGFPRAKRLISFQRDGLRRARMRTSRAILWVLGSCHRYCARQTVYWQMPATPGTPANPYMTPVRFAFPHSWRTRSGMPTSRVACFTLILKSWSARPTNATCKSGRVHTSS